MNGPGRQLFVYWRLKAEDMDRALADMRERQARLRKLHPKLRTGLFERKGGEPTVMETYERQDGIDAEFESELHSALDPVRKTWALGQHHTEVFEPR